MSGRTQNQLIGIMVTTVLTAAVMCAGAIAQADDGPAKGTDMNFTTRIEFGKDIGQNYGSLFEVPTADGKFVIGAGFVGVYNTHHRMDRYAVQLFVRPTDGQREFSSERLPRIGNKTGTYMYDYDGKVYAHTYEEKPFCCWDATTETWDTDPARTDSRMHLGDGVLRFGSGNAYYNEEPLLTEPATGGYSRFYYAHGYLCFYHTDRAGDGASRAYEEDSKGFTKLYACAWTPESEKPIDVSKGVVRTLKYVGETPFAWGQFRTEVLTCSNMGGLYVFDGKEWKMPVEPDNKTSYQIYSMLNFYDRMLMGQYPTGELIEYDGENATVLAGWPPRMEGVSSNAREAQSTTIYGGDLFVGVWPWAEVWRYNQDTSEWFFVQRMFTHPEVTDETTHPYEKECNAHKLVLNWWGQRATSLVPAGDSVYVSTSTKGPGDWKPELDFVGDDKWKEYGTIHRLKTPGNLSAPVQWKNGPTDLGFVISGDALRITQDGTELGSAKLGPELAAAIAEAAGLGDVQWGSGVFGPFAGASLKGELKIR